MRVAWRMSGSKMKPWAQPMVAAMTAKEVRIVQRCRSTSTFASPPRHVHLNDLTEKISLALFFGVGCLGCA